jgi:hypothetical protein
VTDLHPKIPGQYRRAFDWRVSRGNLHSLTTDTTEMVRLASSGFPGILEDFLEISRNERDIGLHLLDFKCACWKKSRCRTKPETLPETPGLQKNGGPRWTPMIKPPADIQPAKRELFFSSLDLSSAKPFAAL